MIGSGLLSTCLISCSNLTSEGMVIFTRVPADKFSIHAKVITHQYPDAQIVAADMADPAGSETILTADFYSACSPRISYNAKHMLFLAQQIENDTWQVWEMDLEDGTSRQITEFDESCSGPAYLPGERLVFSRQMPDVGYGSEAALYTMNLDGSELNRITFQPHFDYSATILRDGRVLMLSQQLYPEAGDQMYLAMRPNGTKAELFYMGTENSVLSWQANETLDGMVYFIQMDYGKDPKADLVSVHQNRPLYTKTNHTSEIPGNFYAAFPMPSGDLLVSYQPSEEKSAGLYRFSINERSPGHEIIGYSDYHIVEPVLLEAYTRPRHLPDEVNKMESTGQLLCQDIHVTANLNDSLSSDFKKATMIEVLGLNESMGIIPVEEDGLQWLSYNSHVAEPVFSPEKGSADRGPAVQQII